MDPLFVFDLDNTLYPREVELWRIVDARIEEYLRRTLGVTAEVARRVRTGYLKEFGTTLRGLMHYHAVAPEDYLEYVHDVPISKIVPPRPELAAMLRTLPGRRVVFTNGSRSYAARVVSALGVEDGIDEIFGIEFMDYVAKPSPYPYDKLLRATGAAPRESLLCEDMPQNIVPARKIGMFTVWVGDGESSSLAHATIPDVCDLPLVLDDFAGWARRASDGAGRGFERAARAEGDGE